MKQSQLFTRTRREVPKDETSKNAQLLIRAGFVHKEMAGVYTFLPLGWRVLNKINQIIREEMNALGGVEMQLTALQNPELWKTTERFSDTAVDIWFKTELKNHTVLGLGFTHEEPITVAMKQHIASYKDLPVYAYQIQTKFRNETRAKSGIMRGREFLMKDLYSFCRTQEELDTFYEHCKEAYMKIFTRVGLGESTFLTFASGGVFTKYSHEFQTLSEAGEDTIYLSREKRIAVNQEVLTDEVLNDLNLKREDLEEMKSIEVGNIFKLGTRFSEPLGLRFVDEQGESHPVIMGSYGVGPVRVMGTIVETLSDDKGMVWPKAVAPFKAHLLSLGQNEEAEKIYRQLTEAGVEVLYDDRDVSAGEKFSDADLMGMPYRMVVSAKSLAAGGVEIKKRTEEKGVIVPAEKLVDYLKQ